MGYDYALVHLQYTIPPAVALTFLYRPLCTSLAIYKVAFLIVIAVISTTPWDSYLIHHKIWTYPPHAILGPTLFSIPAEESFFFVIQTYNTSLLYLLLSTPTFHPIYLCGKKRLRDGRLLWLWAPLGQVFLVGTILAGLSMIVAKGEGLYMGLILAWAGPFILLLWTLAYQFILGLPLSSTLLPIAVPTLYLWLVDTWALKRGTWVIESGTKLGLHLWDGLEIEEAVFFLVTNILIVFGLIAFDNALAILQAFPNLFPTVPALPSPVLLVKALLTPTSSYDDNRVEGLSQALARLKQKSRSFYLASGVFQGRLRIDLILLYSFCRVADDLVDNASTVEEAMHWVHRLKQFLTISYDRSQRSTRSYIMSVFPESVQSALVFLPTSYLSLPPLYDLLEGFETDLNFSLPNNVFPIHDKSALQIYASRVAGTVAESCLELVYHHSLASTSDTCRQEIIQAGGRMGVALQYINIARDIAVDARIGRIYIPASWLEDEGLTPSDVLKYPKSAKVEALRQRLLDEAMEIYHEAKGAIDRLPLEARGPMKVAVESYVEIGRVLRTRGYKIKAGRATVPKLRRVMVAWKALTE